MLHLTLLVVSKPTIAYRQHASNQCRAPRHRKYNNKNTKKTEPFTLVGSAAIKVQANLYKEAYIRLLKFSERTPNVNIDLQIHQLKEKVDFLYARAALPNKRWRRLPQTLFNLVTLNYHHYGRGWTHFINDLAREEVRDSEK